MGAAACHAGITTSPGWVTGLMPEETLFDYLSADRARKAAVQPERSTCSGCGRAIIWITSKNGKPMPVDLRSVTGHLYVIDGDDTHALTEAVPTGLPERIYLSHFLTCPEASRFSGQRA